MRRRRARVRLEDPAAPVLARRRLRGVPVMVSEECGVDALDAHERAHGGRWRESDRLLPDEVVIRDERLV